MKAAVPALLLVAAAARGADELRNWFDDPFFQITNAIADCPLPAGPFVSEARKIQQSHYRAEKGTTCWLAGECDRPKAFLYDADIAAAFREALRRGQPFADTTLWVTIQGRVVYVEGCVGDPALEGRIEAFVRALPYVQQALAIVRSDPKALPPYQLRTP